jgi:hypothetical protein
VLWIAEYIHILYLEEDLFMTFDIHQQIFDADGQPLERVAREYQNELIDLFEQSPEKQTLREEGIDGGWPRIMLDLGQTYLSVTPPKMSAKDLREILFDLIPLKITAFAEQAPEVIRELQGFWQFLQREFDLPNAAECLDVLDDEATQRLKEEMSNPDNFGMAKSFAMAGIERGFDMRTQEGADAWMRTYNAELAAGKAPPFNLTGFQKQIGIEKWGSLAQMLEAPEEDYVDADIIDELDEDLLDLVSHSHLGVPSRSSRKSSNKQKAKMAKASRKRNRKKK